LQKDNLGAILGNSGINTTFDGAKQNNPKRREARNMKSVIMSKGQDERQAINTH